MTNKQIDLLLKDCISTLSDYSEHSPSDHVEILTCLSSITIFLAEIAKRLPEVKND
jgi:hypothetical protein